MLKITEYTDTALVALLTKGDQLAYAELFHRYKEILYRHAYNILGDMDDAQDIIQEVFIILWQKRDTLMIKGTLSAYLYKAVRNRVFNHLSHQNVVAKYSQSITSFFKEGRCTTDEYIREKELAGIIEREIDSLPPRMREVFILRREAELSYQDIAEKLNISDKTAKLQVAKAVKILRTKIKSYTFIFFLF